MFNPRQHFKIQAPVFKRKQPQSVEDLFGAFVSNIVDLFIKGVEGFFSLPSHVIVQIA